MLDVLAEPLLGAVDRFGYFGIAGLVFIESFGIPAPGETAIIAGSAWAGRGHLNVFVVGLVAFLAATLGDTLGYWIGRRGGRPLAQRYGRYVRLTTPRLERVESFMARQGPKIVVIARFVEGLRQFNGVVAGMTRMPFHQFIVFQVLGAALWVGCWSVVGYFAGDHLDQVTATAGRYLAVVAGLAVLVLVAYVWRRRRARRNADA
jgi:membrane protein DedA with SNARE-associated domain